MRYHFVSTRIAIIKILKKEEISKNVEEDVGTRIAIIKILKKEEISKNVEEDVGKRGLSSFSGGDIKWFSHCRK